MLKRFLRTRGEADAPTETDPRTHMERLLDSALPTLDPGDGSDPLVAVGEALVAAEVAAGLPPIELSPGVRDAFVRTYATLLLDNDRNPPALQLVARELERPRALLVAFFSGLPSMHTEAQVVLRFIEDRFAQGRFAQSRLLLQLFDTDAATRRNNERNLFFEEMALRLLGERSTPLSDSTIADARAGIAAAGAFDEVARTVMTSFGVRLHALGLDVERADAWGSALGATNGLPPAALRRLVPGPRWRPIADGDAVARVQAHIAERGVRAGVLDALRAAYFLTVAPGTPGQESMIVDVLRWMGERFGVVATRLLPRLHKATTLEESSLTDALDELWDEHFAARTEARETFDDEQIRAALDSLAGQLATVDPRRIPDGDYDLGGVVLANLLGVPCGDVATTLRLHRLA
ncbi:MAG: hypothetical protein H6700_02170 [Myxococcales bacterium]|nr:hypothetical protein [Myxococcales bacterium]MCB9521194.1 hypothetical protein [Myxococcales bacterium]MCB9530552.1 hypothetical protein [Myxococcales bacterium]